MRQALGYGVMTVREFGIREAVEVGCLISRHGPRNAWVSICS
jgi:hypothetical protein